MWGEHLILKEKAEESEQVQNFPQLVVKFILKNIRTVEIPWLRVRISAGRALKERQCTLRGRPGM